MSGSQRLSKRDRQQRILAELRVSATLRISELATELGVSYETIRRDLEEMGESGLINRTYGERANAMTAEREQIASLAIRFVQPGEVLMIDAGSTTLHFARRLAAELKDLTVITNSFAVAQALATNPSMTVIACPGRYDAQEGGVGGPDCIAFLGRYNANRAVIGASGLTLEGPNEANSNSAAVKRAMFSRAQERMLLIDHLKFGQPNLEVVCPLNEVNRIVTDKAPSRDMALALRKAEIELNL
jgi:DeoR/GlpR family transcriptional regulator of sugar metabolism